MSFPTIPGRNGIVARRVSSMDKRVIGKLTDANHLESLHQVEPAQYDKEVISIYTESSLFANDLTDMINKSRPFYIRTNSDYWKWDISVPYAYPKIIDIPAETDNMSKVGIDGQEFSLILDTAYFVENDVVTSHRIYAQEFKVIQDPLPANAGYLHKFVLLSNNPKVDFVPKQWLQVGLELEKVGHMTGEFDRKLSGLGPLGDKITLFESLSAGYGVEHSVTKWAEAKTLKKDTQGRDLDLIVYMEKQRNRPGEKYNGPILWEPLIESELRREMLHIRNMRRLWAKGGTAKSKGSKQEIKKNPKGIYYQMRTNGNLIQYNKGQFSIALLRDVFGDLFYRRVPMAQRRVKMYTNEAGIEVFRTAAKNDVLASGLTIIADQRFIQGSGQKMIINWGFDQMVTAETGNMEVIHLMELDLPQLNGEFSRNKKSTPIFMVFDVSPDSDGTLIDNIREVRHEKEANMTWGYVDGRIHHLGFASSRGMSSANSDPWYKIWMEDRSDVFIEDLSRTVLIEEIPQL